MSVPAAADVRAFLEGYDISTSIISDTWIDNDIAGEILPKWQKKTGMHLSAEQEATEYLSGNGQGVLFLSRKSVNSLESITFVSGIDSSLNTLSIGSVELIGDRGMLKRKSSDLAVGASFSFPKGNKNIKVVYKYGGTCPDDVKYALTKWSAVNVLGQISGRTGGGNLGLKDFAGTWGKRGKYTDPRTAWAQQVRSTMSDYSTGVAQS